jgi:hypothetical protein
MQRSIKLVEKPLQKRETIFETVCYQESEENKRGFNDGMESHLIFNHLDECILLSNIQCCHDDPILPRV